MHPDDFDYDKVKITYAVSWLKGTAQQWYELNLSLEDFDLPEYAFRWSAFKEALKTTFGEPDPISSASHKLDNLRMQDHHHITKYNVEFQEYAMITGFDKRALYAKYYKGLAPCIKDGLVYSGRPDTVAELRAQAMNLDLRYWERKDTEKYRTASNLSGQASKSSSGSSQATSPSPSSSKPKFSPAKSQSPSPTAAPSPSKVKKPDLSKVLRPDGKLLPEEKDRHKCLGLCIICAAKDHMSDKCPSCKDVQGRSTQLDPISEDGGSESEAESSESPN